MKKLLKRIWYRIRYKRVEQPSGLCINCMNRSKSGRDCTDFMEIYGSDCDYKIFVKRFEL